MFNSKTATNHAFAFNIYVLFKHMRKNIITIIKKKTLKIYINIILFFINFFAEDRDIYTLTVSTEMFTIIRSTGITQTQKLQKNKVV